MAKDFDLTKILPLVEEYKETLTRAVLVGNPGETDPERRAVRLIIEAHETAVKTRQDVGAVIDGLSSVLLSVRPSTIPNTVVRGRYDI